MKFTSYFTILVSFAASTNAGTNKTLAPTDMVTRAPVPATPFPTEPAAFSTPAPSTSPPTPVPVSHV